jgi:hypothetical protein
MEQPTPQPASPYDQLADILNNLLSLALDARRPEGRAPSYNGPRLPELLAPWDACEQECRRNSAARGIPFTAFDLVLTLAGKFRDELERMISDKQRLASADFCVHDRLGEQSRDPATASGTGEDLRGGRRPAARGFDFSPGGAALRCPVALAVGLLVLAGNILALAWCWRIAPWQWPLYVGPVVDALGGLTLLLASCWPPGKD